MPTIKLSVLFPEPVEFELPTELSTKLLAVVAAHPDLSLQSAVTFALHQFVAVAEKIG